MNEAERDAATPHAPRLLAEIAHTLESSEDAAARVERVLALLQKLIPYDRCALLEAALGQEARLLVVPETAGRERAELDHRLKGFLRLLDDREEVRREADRLVAPPGDDGSTHLALPLVSHERVVGVLFVERFEGGLYDEESLCLLTVVSAQIATYLTAVRLRESEQRALQTLGVAHSFQQMLVGIVSHDLRNPLSAILGSASILLRRTEDAGQIKALDRIVSSTQRATRIINDLLDLTRARLGSGIPISRQRIDLGVVLREGVDEMRQSHPGRRLEVDAVAGVVGDWDGDRISQAVTNLMVNALHYGTPEAPVRVTLRALEAHVTIEVHNRGAAIPPLLLAHIFDPFKRGERQLIEGNVQGLGLGLYIVQQIILAHGGQTEARSTAADGTLFTIVLPR